MVQYHTMGTGRVDYTPGKRIIHFGSPAPSARTAKKRALEDLYGGDVPDSTADRLIMREHRGDPVHPFVD